MASAQFDSISNNSGLNQESSQGIDIFGFLRRRKSFIILLGLVGVGIAYLLFEKQKPLYRSVARVQVVHRSADPMMKTVLADKDLSDSAYVIKSPRVLVAAIEKHNLSQLMTLRGLSTDESVAKLTSMVVPTTLSSAVIEIAVSGHDAGDIHKIANAVAEEYLEVQKENYADASGQLQSLLTKARDEIHESLLKAEAAHAEFRRTSRLSVTGDNPHAAREQKIQEQISAIELDKAKLQSELLAITEALNAGGSREAITLLVGRQTSAGSASTQSSANAVDATVSSAKTMAEELFPLMKEEAVLAAELGADHPRLKAIRLQIDLTRRHLQALAGMVPENSEQVAPPDFLSIYLQSKAQEIAVLEKQQADMKSLAAKEEDLARSLSQEVIDDRNKMNEINRLAKLFEGVTLQINQIKVNADMGGVTAQMLAPARHGGLVYPILETFLAMGGVLGAFAGLVIGYLVEIADRSFRKPEEIIREFGIPIMGHVPFMDDARLKSVPKDAILDRTAITVHLPRSRPAEAYRAVRTAVRFSPIGSDHRLIQVTSPAAGDGKSTLALNLALSMAQAGKKTVLMESDFRRPKVHKLTGVSSKVGVVDVLRGTAELSDAIQSTIVPDFFVLPCGSRPKDPSELLSRPEYEQLLQVLREKFDVVIIDTPPVMAVTDPCSVAPRVDGVVICMRLSRHTRELGRRTIEQLKDVGGNVAGVVINGVEERDTYGYANYRYSDYRYYYKNYSENEYGGKSGNDAYFSDERHDEEEVVT
ncbi:MAG: polysaccharide biosynthesis tyrosine autokinase [Planctomyces sp.]|nr:polysaccharide biosynthesis tyrosine autokinase [Planctomyces sp.]